MSLKETFRLAGLPQRIGDFARAAFSGIASHLRPTAPKICHAIEPGLFLKVIADSFREKRIDLYQAALLLEINHNQGDEDQTPHALQLIRLHNDASVDFSHKTGILLQGLMKSSYTYEDLKKSGLLLKGSRPEDHYTLDDLTQDNGIQLAQPEALHTDGRRKEEIVKKPIFESNIKDQTYSAIPKSLFLELIKDAVAHKRIDDSQTIAMLAVVAHSLEKRKTGNRRYIDHPMGVAGDSRLNNFQRLVALIHDGIENSNYTLDDLKEMGIRKAVIFAVDHMTIRSHEKEKYDRISVEDLRALAVKDLESEPGYFSFIVRCSQNLNSLAVKMADIRHNLTDNPAPEKILIYKVALGYLEAIQNNHIKAGSSLPHWAKENMPEEFEAALQIKRNKIFAALTKKTGMDGDPQATSVPQASVFTAIQPSL